MQASVQNSRQNYPRSACQIPANGRNIGVLSHQGVCKVELSGFERAEIWICSIQFARKRCVVGLAIGLSSKLLYYSESLQYYISSTSIELHSFGIFREVDGIGSPPLRENTGGSEEAQGQDLVSSASNPSKCVGLWCRARGLFRSHICAHMQDLDVNRW